MNRKQRRATIGAVSPATAARLAQVLLQLGSDATQPPQHLMNEAWAKSVFMAFRPEILTALKAMAGGTAGFDYGPCGMTIIRWVCINRLSRYATPDVIWLSAKAGGKVPTCPPMGKRKVTKQAPAGVSIDVGPPVGTVTLPTLNPNVVHGVQQPGMGLPPIIITPVPHIPAPSVAEALESVAEATAEATRIEVPPDLVMAGPYVSPAEKAHPEWDWQPAAKVFGVKGLRGKVAVWPAEGTEGAHKQTVAVDPDYVWSKEHLQWAVFSAGEYPAKGEWFWGNRGSGKTTFAEQFAARTGRPFFAVTFALTMEPSDFIGDMGIEMTGGNGGNKWQDGAMMQALRCDTPAVILLDEISQAKAGFITGPLNDIVHPKCSFRIARSGERVAFHKAHLFFAADNTNGTGDTTSMYQGANMMNRATMDRFSYFRQFTYMPKLQEVKLLMLRAHCSQAIAEQVWGVLDALRKKVASGQLADPPSMREAIAFCAALRGGFNKDEAFESSFVGKYPEEVQEDMRVTFVAAFNATAS